MLINAKEKVGIKKFKNPKAFINYLQTHDDVYENLEGYNPTKQRKALIVFDDMETNKKLIPIVTKLSLRGQIFLPHNFISKCQKL